MVLECKFCKQKDENQLTVCPRVIRGKVEHIDVCLDCWPVKCADHLKPIVLTALNTGMRKGEILDLTWNQINFKEKLIQVGRGKTMAGEFRIIPMNSDLTGALSRVKKIGTYVFCHPDGQRYGNIRTAFEKAVKRAGIPHIRFHDLRHTFATRYMGKGDILTLKDILGHKTIEMTMRYAHPTLNKKRWCMEVLNEDSDGHLIDTKPKEGKQIFA